MKGSIKKSVLQRIVKEELARLSPKQKKILQKRLVEETDPNDPKVYSAIDHVIGALENTQESINKYMAELNKVKNFNDVIKIRTLIIKEFKFTISELARIK